MDRTGLRIPLHVAPADRSQAAMRRRYELHVRMMALNPAGWRQPPKNEARRHRRKTRIERLFRAAHPTMA